MMSEKGAMCFRCRKAFRTKKRFVVRAKVTEEASRMMRVCEECWCEVALHPRQMVVWQGVEYALEARSCEFVEEVEREEGEER